MTNAIRKEMQVLKSALAFLPKWQVDAVTMYLDREGLYALHYNPLTDSWHLSDGEHYHTKTLLLEGLKRNDNIK